MATLKPVSKETVLSLRLSSERRLQEELLKDSGIQKASQDLRGKNGAESQRRRLLAESLRITDRIIPSLVESVRYAQGLAQLQDRRVEIYVCDEPRQNASCIDFGDGNIFLLFTSSLLELMAPRELLFVAGHELGHACFGHHSLPSSALLQSRGALTGDQALKLMSWSRRAEISCDRLGILCCQSLQAATTALIKLSSGLREPLLKFDLDDYLSQMREIQTLSESVDDAGDWFSSHPFNPLRVSALHHFWESQPLTDILGHGAPRCTGEQLEGRIDGLLKSMEPQEAEARDASARETLLWGGYWVAAAEGGFKPEELQNIRGSADAEAVRQAEEQIRAAPDPSAFIRERFQQAARRCRRLAPADRYALVQKLILVARADQGLAEEEKAVLRQACREFDVNPGFVDQILLMTE